ncbi:helix-turn-helix domain-containing protein [Streptosporangium carneum]|uniref:Transcriptional regulator n=1 Tax=Streptosporangium carneum TaxID=47481 RepID=A0A9W6I4V8_9ACTN|nr:helix-turn-helix transcriptional regulator [Streptosporangium carneum]GLK11249.1 transcriptional regulator [Streptosporangium carneum]
MDISSRLDPTVSPHEYFLLELRRHRKAAGVSQDELARRTGWSDSQISMIENGHRRPTRSFVEATDRALDLDGALLDLYDMLHSMASRIPEWFRPWIEIEREAESLRNWQPLIVPGLLQTRDYAHAMLAGEPRITPERLEEYVATRLERQTILSKENRPMLWVVMDEGILYRPIGGAEVMSAQLRHLVEAGDHPDTVIQILPLKAGSTAGLSGGFSIAQASPSRGATCSAYMEFPGTGHVTDRPTEVAALALRYEAIRAEAMSRRESLELIKEALATWN